MLDAELVLGMCTRFHCLPSQLDEEAAEIIRLVNIYNTGTKQEEGTPLEGE